MKKCEHDYKWRARHIDNKQELVYDIFYCRRCLEWVKKLRPCPKDIQEVK